MNDTLILILYILAGVVVLGGLAFVFLKGPKAPKGGYPETRDEDDTAPPVGEKAEPGYETPAPVAGRLQRLRARLARSNSMLGKGLLALLSSEKIDQDVWDEIEETLLTGARTQGYLVRDTAAALLHVSPRAAWEHLNRLSRAGRLTKVGVRYYPAGNAVAEADHLPILRAYLQKEGAAGRQALAEQLRIDPKQATHILKRMVDSGALELVGKRYRLPENTD